ncbi:PIG-L family deacetylase [Streptomyces sp. NPDC001941]|uniref:PIG-L family deacetylase n=1 Tax=Streptomyces sp. NPDC001941 TaxID=3154659 RepID=UPI0033277E27
MPSRTPRADRTPRTFRPRRAVAALAGAATLAAGFLGGALWLTSDTSDASDVPSKGVPVERAAQPVRTGGTSVLQIVAHPDDDLYFMNPDTLQSVRSGNSLTGVYLTAGESDGVNARKQDPRPRPNKANYAEARQNGIRAAYAEMATGNRTSPWDRVSIPTAGGGTAELDTLRAQPRISLVWIQLKEAGSISGDRPNSLHGLWDGRVGSLRSQLAAGSPVRRDFSYTKQQLVDTVEGLLQRFRPTFVRMQDPTPGFVEKPGRAPKLSDHQDHMYGARFAQAALARYAAAKGHAPFGVQNYLGYFTSGLPRTLDPASSAEKLGFLKTYAWMDHGDYCRDQAGCGDRKVAANPAGHNWAHSVRYTRSNSTSWVQPGGDGGLWAFSVLDGRLAVWHKARAAKEWGAPRLLAGDGIDSGVTSLRLPDGRIAVFGTRTDLDGGYHREVVATVQRAPGGGFGPWRSLGTPERDDASGTSDISAPAVLADKAGRVTVYLRDSAHRLSASTGEPDGNWAPWRRLDGPDVHGDPVAATDAKGRGYVFAATARSVVAWAQQAPDAPLSGPVRTGLPATTLALSAAADGDGVRLWFRRPVSGDAQSARFSGSATPAVVVPAGRAPGGRSGAAPSLVSTVPGAGGYGPVSAAPQGVLALRSRTGGLATAPLDGAAAPRWTTGNRLFSGAPAGVPQGVAAVGLDGRLLWLPRHG